MAEERVLKLLHLMELPIYMLISLKVCLSEVLKVYEGTDNNFNLLFFKQPMLVSRYLLLLRKRIKKRRSWRMRSFYGWLGWRQQKIPGIFLLLKRHGTIHSILNEAKKIESLKERTIVRDPVTCKTGD